MNGRLMRNRRRGLRKVKKRNRNTYRKFITRQMYSQCEQSEARNAWQFEEDETYVTLKGKQVIAECGCTRIAAPNIGPITR